jgi:hypothetical protein
VVSDDMVRQYLRDTVIVERWSTVPAATDPATAATETTEPATSAT